MERPTCDRRAFLLVGAGSVVARVGRAAAEPAPFFRWRPSHLGGGGYITGVLQDPCRPDTLYARCDVAGVYKSTDGAASWQPVNAGMTLCHHHSVQSFAVSPHEPRMLFRASGEARGGRVFGSIHRSTDRGASWSLTCEDADFYGNGPTRQSGEVLAVSAHEPRRVLAGAFTNGLFASADLGLTWRRAGLEGERISCVAFHPLVPGRVLAGTLPDEQIYRDAEAARRHGDRLRSRPGRLWVSEDAGESWRVLAENGGVSEIAFDAEDPELLHLALRRGGLARSRDGGRTLERVEAVTGGQGCLTVTVSPHDTRTLYAALDMRGQGPSQPPVAIHRSRDRGETWTLVRHHSASDLRDYPAYMTPFHAGWAISKVRVDLQRPDRLYFSNWYGVTVSDDAGQTWNAHQFAGLENTCMETVVAGVRPRWSFAALADHRPLASGDDGRTYEALPGLEGYNGSTAVAVSRHRPGMLLAGLTERGGSRGAAVVVIEGEAAGCRLSRAFGPGTFVQGLAEDPFRPGAFWAQVDGDLERGAGLFRTDDWGASWSKVPLGWPAHVRTLPHQREWIEAELLSVVVYQVKNVCGANQLLCPDPHRPNTLYVGEWTEGLLRTTDGGRSWTNLKERLPFGRVRASVLVCVRADERRAGVLYAGFLREGLWGSEDGGDSWFRLFPRDGAFNASSIAVGGPSGDEIVVASEPLFWAPSPSAVFWSGDRGRSFTEISDRNLGAVRYKGVALDRATGTIHAVSCGNGAFRAERG